jgi:hypothetical protein
VNFSIFSFDARKFVLVFAVLFSALGISATFLRVYFYYTGDLLTEAQAIALQQASVGECDYQSAGGKNYFSYKKELNRTLKPEIVSLGSSLAAKFSQNMFIAKFANLGMTIEDMNDISSAVRQLTEVHKPKHVIFVVDIWWFNPKFRPLTDPIDPNDAIVANDPAVLRTLVTQTWKRPKLLSFVSEVGIGPQCPVGSLAKLYPSGFARDGSRDYGERLVISPQEQEDYQFRDTLKRIEKGKRRFEHASETDDRLIERFLDVLASLKSQDIGYTLVVAPVAPQVYKKMTQSGNYGFIPKLFEKFQQKNLLIQNYLDPASLGITDCEFLDGFHLGDVGMAKLLRGVANKDKIAKSFINDAETQRLAAMNGRAMALITERFNTPENDFLGLGCSKL